MGWRTRTSALPIRDLHQIAYLLPMWGGIWSSVVFLWRRLTCPQNGSLRMFWYRDLNSSHFFPRFGALDHEANRTPDICATFISSRKKACKHKRMSVCPARKGKPSILSVFYRLNRCSRWRTNPFRFCAKIWSARAGVYWNLPYQYYFFKLIHIWIFETISPFLSGLSVGRKKLTDIPQLQSYDSILIPVDNFQRKVHPNLWKQQAVWDFSTGTSVCDIWRGFIGFLFWGVLCDGTKEGPRVETVASRMGKTLMW